MLIYTCVYDMKSKEKVTCKLFGVISSSVLNGKISPLKSPLQLLYVSTDVQCVHAPIMCVCSCVGVCVFVCVHFFSRYRNKYFSKEN